MLAFRKSAWLLSLAKNVTTHEKPEVLDRHVLLLQTVYAANAKNDSAAAEANSPI